VKSVVINSLVMVVYCDGQCFLGMVLADHVFMEVSTDLNRTVATSLALLEMTLNNLN